MNYKKMIEDFNNGTIDKEHVTLVAAGVNCEWC
jgi:hypothetical protein